jgi:hypothetical protein
MGANGANSTASYNQQQAARKQKTEQEFARAKTYCLNLYTDAALDPIRPKVQLNPDVPLTFEMLSNEDHVTPDERPIIRDCANRAIQCQTEVSSAQRRFLTPIHVTLANGFFDAANALRAALHNGQVSYGEYNRQRREAQTDYEAAWARLDAELARQDAEARYRAQQIAQQQYQNYLTLQQNFLQQQQQLNQHGTVTCRQIGSFGYCDY